MFILTGYYAGKYVTVTWNGKSICDDPLAMNHYNLTLKTLDGIAKGIPPANEATENHDQVEGAALTIWHEILEEPVIIDGPDWATGEATP